MSARPRFAFSLFVVSLVLAFAPAAQAGRPGGGGGGGGKGSTLTLTDLAVVPGPGEFGASATAVISVGHGEVCYTITVDGLNAPITRIAIYKAPAGQTGPMAVQLTPSPIGLYQLNACAVTDAGTVRDIQRNPSSYYVQIDTSLFPYGALRAQLQ